LKSLMSRLRAAVDMAANGGPRGDTRWRGCVKRC
jgi:hypothetical protein